MGIPFGEGLDGRHYTDLSRLPPGSAVIPSEQFFVRTRASELLAPLPDWPVHVGGLIRKELTVSAAELASRSRPTGIHVMECSGNTEAGSFGLLSAAGWTGVRIMELFRRVEPLPAAKLVMVSGFDTYPRPSRHGSLDGASWIFTPEQLERSGAFLATGMNDQPLTPDHGAPVRLVVPGWYGCVSIKWVQRIDFLPGDATATTQMREFAERTHQQGVPTRAMDYRPARMEQAALPVQVRRSANDGRLRIFGITWGGELVPDLSIRIGEQGAFQPVTMLEGAAGTTAWKWWEYHWEPVPGTHRVELRVNGAREPTRRLARGHYARYLRV